VARLGGVARCGAGWAGRRIALRAATRRGRGGPEAARLRSAQLVSTPPPPPPPAPSDVPRIPNAVTAKPIEYAALYLAGG